MIHKTVIHMLDGSVWAGTLDTDLDENFYAAWNGSTKGGPEQFYFASRDGRKSGLIRFDSVKTIYLDTESGSETSSGLRFFDSAPIPSLLWVRATFVDGEIVEGMVPNQWSTFNGTLVSLMFPDQQVDQGQVLIPRSSIAELQVITTR